MDDQTADSEPPSASRAGGNGGPDKAPKSPPREEEKGDLPVAYQRLAERAKEVALIGDTGALLSWDQETGMPREAVAYRAQQAAWIAGECHRRFTHPEVGDWLSACEEGGVFDSGSAEAANVREWRHEYDRSVRLPEDLVTRMQEATSHAKAVWAEARERSDFSHFAPQLRDLVELSQRKAEYWGYDERPYDALLDSFERGAHALALEELFGSLENKLVTLVEEAVERTASEAPLQFAEPFPIPQQEAFNREVAEAVGFEFAAGRIDTAVHPFCSGMGPRDVRLTTRYDEADFRSSLFGVLHEAGHGLYEQGLPPERRGEPLGAAVSLGIHESQSRLWENHVGRSLAFWEKWLPRAAAHFPQLRKLDPETLTRSVNRVERSFIRVEADEATYDLHILLRFEIERALFNGDLAVDDLPAAWNERMSDLLHLEVKDDAEGCLQDIHWSLGLFGYFPTYSLGNLNASHLFAAALSQRPEIEGQLASGEYSGLLGWLRETVHGHGSRYLPDELVRRATGAETDPRHHLKHLETRYLADPV